ncbi:hypothetical protein ECANGB1_1780 [Enterospora canceri]|uniref:Signal peptidase complex subunit 2 n=1 Tax=Enterospora canceri TaxID=1081671 RepID=A0A1Y1S667_9MICR|nr:hypothetical protein ECANGB1_1780 [Enterospora canceri]
MKTTETRSSFLDQYISEKTKKMPYVDLHTRGNVRIVLNEFVVEYLAHLGYKQGLFYDNIKIVIGALSAVFGAVICYLSMTYRWDAIELYVSAMVLGYYVINVLYFGIDYLDNKCMKFYSKGKMIEIKTELNVHGIYSLRYRNKEHKALICDLIYETGQLDVVETVKWLNGIFK